MRARLGERGSDSGSPKGSRLMPALAVIDDRADQRETVVRLISAHLPEGRWEILDSPPLPQLASYAAWLRSNDVAALILDEKLQEHFDDEPIDYEGHDVVECIRERNPTLPIFVVTAFEKDEELLRRFADVEEIINRNVFAEKAKEYVARFIRSGNRFWSEHEGAMRRLGEIAERIAIGEATDAEKEEATGLQARMALTLQLPEVAERSEELRKLEELLIELDRMREDAEGATDDQ